MRPLRVSGWAKAWEWAKSVAVALVLWYVLTSVLIQAFHIPSGSMERTLLQGDFLFANKLLYGAEVPLLGAKLPAIREPKRGDIVIFESVTETGVNVVKRVVGMPGDTIEMIDGESVVNGQVLPEPYVGPAYSQLDPADPQMRRWQRGHYVGAERTSYRPTLKNWGPLVVPPDSFFVMGDNRENSFDSRYWGFLGRDRIRGHPMLVYYSYNSNGMLPFPFLTSIRWGRLFSRPD